MSNSLRRAIDKGDSSCSTRCHLVPASNSAQRSLPYYLGIIGCSVSLAAAGMLPT